MKSPLSFLHRYRQTRSGIALISVLAMVVLLTALVVAFMLRAGSERQSSGFYKAETGSRALADTAINLVQAQINDATSQGPTYAWASQPGAIRTYDSTGALFDYYRLYSNAAMRTTDLTTVGQRSTGDVPTQGTAWLAQSAIWVDLNAPVNNDPNQAPINTHFPILDPRDPSNLGNTIAMDGFSIDQTNVPTNTYANNIDTNLNKDPAPMPVQWLYVLQDGSVIPPDSGSSNGTLVTFANAPAAHQVTVTNPIVGRIAFWTDDETCKVNINTAGGDGLITSAKNSVTGHADASDVANKSYWAVPCFWSADDTNGGYPNASLGLSQPASGEYQRYPGHPATVALNEIFNSLGVTALSTNSSTPFYSQYSSAGVWTPGLTPRYAWGGSQGGTTYDNAISTGSTTSPWAQGSTYTAAVVPTASFRLYPSVGELLFNPDGTSSSARTATALNTSASDTTAGTTRQRMETARFFLTAHSRAPELNLFGLPRISMWPLPYSATNSTTSFSPVDQLIQFCSTIGGKAYYFVRGITVGTGAVNSTYDIGLARNQTILNYLKGLTSVAVPGFSNNSTLVTFSQKNYGNTSASLVGENTQIINEIFDYIRITNVNDTTNPGAAYGPTGWQGSGLGYNQITPSVNATWGTQGEGSYPRLVDVTLQFVAMGLGGSTTQNALPVNPAEVSSGLNLLAAGDNTTSSYTYAYVPITTGSTTAYTDGSPYAAPGDTKKSGAPATGGAGPFNTIAPVYNYSTGLTSGIPPDGTTAVQAFLIFTFLQPAESWLIYDPYIWVNVSGQAGFSLNSHSLGFTDPEAMVCFSSQDYEGGGRSGYIPMFCMTQGKGLAHGSRAAAFGTNPFFSKILPISRSGSMTFAGGSLTIKVYDGAGSSVPGYTTSTPGSTHLVQTYNINIPGAQFPVPTVPPNPYGSGSTAVSTSLNNQYPLNITSPAQPLGPIAAGTPLPSPLVSATYIDTADGVTTGTFPEISYGSKAFLRPTIPYGTAAGGVTAYETTGPIMFCGNPSGTYPGPPNYPSAAHPESNDLNFDRGTFWAGYQGPFNGMSMIGPGDVVQSMVLSKYWSDPRLLAVTTVPTSAWTTHPLWATQQFAHNLSWGMVAPLPGNGATASNTWSSWSSYPTLQPGAKGSLAGNNVDANMGSWPWAPPESPDNSIPPTRSGAPPDWDSGEAQQADGPWINKPDEGCGVYANGNGVSVPYYGNPVLPIAVASLFSANREVCSPGMFGSLPTGVDPTGNNPAPWQTLLFRPGPAGHPGSGSPGYPPYSVLPDHLWMDLFWMPVAEPYAISEPFSTGGKVNLNYEIEPFNYIKRATAIRAAMATEKVAEVSLAQGQGNYKISTILVGAKSGNPAAYARFPIDLDVTMEQFEDRFNATNTSGVNNSAIHDIFRSASQICEIYLVPGELTTIPSSAASPPAPLTPAQGISYNTGGGGAAAFAADWYAPVVSSSSVAPYAMAGDNLRELPYAHLYGKVTTKSNTYTVYYRVQTLQSPPASMVPVGSWDDTKGAITGEYRGSTTLERYLDPTKLNAGGTATDYPDFATGSLPATNLEGYYQWRIVENRQFTP